MATEPTILGIETSCDETAAAVVTDVHQVRSNVVATQFDVHAKYGGVVPELASRAHIENLDGVIREAMRQAGVTSHQIDAIAESLGFETRHEAQRWLAERGVPINYSLVDLEQDRKNLNELFGQG